MARNETDILEVTPENFGDLLVESARQAVSIARRDAPELRKRIRKQNSVVIPPPPHVYTPEQIHALRIRLGLKQRQFAAVLSVSDKTVKAWEQGVNRPSGPALRLLQIMERHPEVLAERLEA
ncbi:MAG: type II toxin-antitoxin system MqsA family antitoxin [Chloroflexota bacterium]|nr:type II toxin-antitoxin system MqsA family antitoxin [Chloroflexota bacterium]